MMDFAPARLKGRGPALPTPRQIEILRLRAMGRTIRQVAIELDVAEQTVKNHLADAYRKMQVSCMQDAFRALGWLRVPEE
jgi:DNA-binding NarL/FixJ family response regulator